MHILACAGVVLFYEALKTSEDVMTLKHVSLKV